MPGFRLRYTAWVDYVDSMGMGMNAVNVAGQSFGQPSGQTLQFNQTTCPGSATFTAADINNMLSSMQTDLSAQLTANLTRISGFSTGGG